MMALVSLFFIAAAGLLAVAAISDIRFHIIRNWVSIALAALGLGAIALSGLPLEAAAAQVGVGAGAFVLGFVLFALGVWGGGDAKLFAAAALWFDPAAAVQFVAFGSIAGGALGLVCLLCYGWRFQLWMAPGMQRLPFEKWRNVAPYGVAIAAGAYIAAPGSAMFQSVFG